MKTKSQLEVCGAPISTVGRSGAGSDTMRHELKVQNVRAMRRRRNMETSLGDGDGDGGGVPVRLGTPLIVRINDARIDAEVS